MRRRAADLQPGDTILWEGLPTKVVATGPIDDTQDDRVHLWLGRLLPEVVLDPNHPVPVVSS